MAVRADDVDLQRDAALVERFQTGDEAAFTDLYERYFNRLRRYCLGQLRDPHDAEEATQEALLRAYRALPRLSGDRHFYPWLRVIASNLCADMRRRKSALPLAEPEGGDAVVESLFDVLDAEQVRTVLEGLNPRHQTALSLWAEGYPSRHIAAELGCTRGAADVTLHRARQSFRRRFLALNTEGRFGAVGGLGLVSSVVRWAQRARVRVSTRVAEHPELTSPLATKLAAGALAFGVVGGSFGAASADPVQKGAATPPVVAVRSVPAPTRTEAGSPSSGSPSAPGRAATHASAVTVGRPASAAPSGSPGKKVGPVLVTSYDDAARRSQDAPVRVQVGTAFVAADPAQAIGKVQDTLRNPQGKQ